MLPFHQQSKRIFLELVLYIPFTFQDAGEQTPKGRKKGHGNSVKAVCHVLSMVLVLAKAGGCRLLSGFYTGIDPACPAVELYAKRVNKNTKLLSQVD